MSNKELAEELHKPIIKKIKKKKSTLIFYRQFGVLIKEFGVLIKEFVLYYVLLILLVNAHGLFL